MNPKFKKGDMVMMKATPYMINLDLKCVGYIGTITSDPYKSECNHPDCWRYSLDRKHPVVDVYIQATERCLVLIKPGDLRLPEDERELEKV